MGLWYAATSSCGSDQDPQTLSITSESFLGNSRTEPGHLRLKFALGGGGIYVSGPTEAYAVNASVSAFGFAAGGNAMQAVAGLWTGWNAGPALATGSAAPTATSLWALPKGQNNANALALAFADPDTAAIVALNDIYPWSKLMNREWGGRICSDMDGKYRWARPRAGEARRLNLDFFTEECAPYGTTVAFYHTHPQSYAEANVPSGYASEAEYNEAGGSDLKWADSLPNKVWYLLAPNVPVTPTHFLRYQGPNSKKNIWEYNSVQDSWHRFPDAPW